MSDNYNKMVQAFIEGLDITAKEYNDALEYQGIQQWDSVGHMALISALESQFDIMLDTDDVIDMSSVKEAVRILAKYDVTVTLPA